jgi:hypothetical protein
MQLSVGGTTMSVSRASVAALSYAERARARLSSGGRSRRDAAIMLALPVPIASDA